MFAIRYIVGNKFIKQDEEQVDVETLADAELVAVHGCGSRLGVENLGVAYVNDLVYGVYVEGQYAGCFRIRSL